MPNVVPENFFYASTFPLRALRRRTSHNIADGIFLFLHLTTECGSERNNNGRFVYLVSCCFLFLVFLFFSRPRGQFSPGLSSFLLAIFPATCAAPVSLTCICRRTPSPKRNILVLERGRFSAGPRDAGHVQNPNCKQTSPLSSVVATGPARSVARREHATPVPSCGPVCFGPVSKPEWCLGETRTSHLG